MRRIFLLFVILFLTHDSLAYATSASSSFSVSVTVVKPGTLHPQAFDASSSAGAIPSDPQATVRFSSTDDVIRRGEIFPK